MFFESYRIVVTAKPVNIAACTLSHLSEARLRYSLSSDSSEVTHALTLRLPPQ